MKPAPFEYVAPEDVTTAVDALHSAEEGRVLAGGQSLVPLMNLRLARPSLLVDINGLRELDFVNAQNGEVRVGALCRHRRLELDPEIHDRVPLLAQAAALVGHPQIRNRATFGGSLAHGDPVAELAAALIALDGRVRAVSAGGTREIAAGELFTGFFTTALAPDELLTEVIVPSRMRGEGSSFVEFAPRHGDFAVVGVAARVARDDDGRCSLARGAACGLGATPVDLSATLEDVVGAVALTDDLLRAVAGRVARAHEPIGDVHASAEDRRELAQLLTVDALREAWDRAGGPTR